MDKNFQTKYKIIFQSLRSTMEKKKIYSSRFDELCKPSLIYFYFTPSD